MHSKDLNQQVAVGAASQNEHKDIVKTCLKALLLFAATRRSLLVVQEYASSSTNIASTSICIHPSKRFQCFCLMVCS